MSNSLDTLDALKQSLATTNSEIESQFQTIESRYSDLVNHHSYLRSLLTSIRHRPQELTAYTTELAHKRDLLTTMRQTFLHLTETTQSSLDSKISLSADTLSKLTRELSLLTDRYQSAVRSVHSLHHRIDRYREEVAKLERQKNSLNSQIASLSKSPPDRFTPELTILKKKLEKVESATTFCERQIISHELEIVSIQSEKRKIENDIARLAGESGALEGRNSADFEGLHSELNFASESFYVLQAKQLEFNAKIERLHYKNDLLRTTFVTSKSSLKKTVNKIESLKNEIERTVREIEESQEFTERCESLTEDMRLKRTKHENEKVKKLFEIRNEFKETRYRIGRFQKVNDQNIEKVEQTLNRIRENLKCEDERNQHLIELAIELKRVKKEAEMRANDHEAAHQKIEELNEIEKAITMADRQQSDLQSKRLKLRRPIPIPREKVPESGKSLKRKIRKLNTQNENLRYSIGILETQIESTKREVLLATADRDHSVSIARFFKKKEVKDDSLIAKTVALRRLQSTKTHLILQSERVQSRIANRRWNVDLKKRRLEALKNVQEFDQSVWVVISPLRRPTNCQKLRS
jgi:chromosome segregation ATPase